MAFSMTGYGSSEVELDGFVARAEVRSVNNRFLEMTIRLPRTLQLRENDVKEQVRKILDRGKINVSISVEKNRGEEIPVKLNTGAAKAYYKVLEELRTSLGITKEVSIQELMSFSEIFEAPEEDETNEQEWNVALEALNIALKKLMEMRQQEGSELTKDVIARVKTISSIVDEIDTMSKQRIPDERNRLRERVAQLASDSSVIDEKRLELEIILLSDKLDITEECVRFRSHNKFFLDALAHEEAAGRKLTFLLQEMNREANTIGSKASDAEISQKIVFVKEELEKIREQLQNIE